LFPADQHLVFVSFFSLLSPLFLPAAKIPQVFLPIHSGAFSHGIGSEETRILCNGLRPD
jgi:hypothetical protein